MIRLRSAFAAATPLALAAFPLSPLAAQTTGEPAAERQLEAESSATAPTKGEARLAKLLEGRVAGEPVRCIRTVPSQRMQTIPGTAYVYGSGNTVYVQRTRDPDQIDRNDIMVARRFNASEICRLDQITTIERTNGTFTGVVFFEDFVPYTRIDSDAG